MFWEIAESSLNLGCYYGGIAFFTVLWIGIYAFYLCLFWRICRGFAKLICKGYYKLKEKFKREKDVQEKATEE